MSLARKPHVLFVLTESLFCWVLLVHGRNCAFQLAGLPPALPAADLTEVWEEEQGFMYGLGRTKGLF